MPSDVGPNFESGKLQIGRERLSEGLVAILDDRARLTAALIELHAYALAERHSCRPRRGIVFRVVTEGERDAVNYRIQEQIGIATFAEAAAVFNVRIGDWHVIDHHHLVHICNRHADAKKEASRGQIPITQYDLGQIPMVVVARNIIDFRVVGEMPRIVYRMLDERGALVAIEEIRRKDGLILKTLYREKK